MKIRSFTFLFQRDLILKVLMFFLIPISAVFLFRSPHAFEYKYEIGSVWLYDDVVAPFSFPIYKDEKQYQEELEKVYSRVYFIFDVDTQVYKNQLNELRKFLTNLKSYLDLKQNYQVKLNQRINLNLLKHDSIEIENLRENLIQKVTNDELNKIESMYKIGYFDFNKLKIVGETYLALVYQPVGVISVPRSELKRNEIVLRRGKFEEVYKQGKFYDLRESFELAKELTRRNFPELIEVDSVYFDIIAPFFNLLAFLFPFILTS
ncbi:7TM-HD extracellular, partial [Candidatus Kryptobacter tengchongensis]